MCHHYTISTIFSHLSPSSKTICSFSSIFQQHNANRMGHNCFNQITRNNIGYSGPHFHPYILRQGVWFHTHIYMCLCVTLKKIMQYYKSTVSKAWCILCFQYEHYFQSTYNVNHNKGQRVVPEELKNLSGQYVIITCISISNCKEKTCRHVLTGVYLHRSMACKSTCIYRSVACASMFSAHTWFIIIIHVVTLNSVHFHHINSTMYVIFFMWNSTFYHSK